MSEDRQRALDHLEAERRGRAFGAVGAAAAAIGEWLRWLHDVPGMLEVVKRVVPVMAVDTPPAHTTTYTRVAVPKEAEQPHDEPRATEWQYVHVTVERPTDTSPGAIEEAEFAISGGQILLRDLDGYQLGSRRLEPNEDPATAARRMLRGKVPKRTKLVFPEMGIA
jgi:hypothetical protein